MASPLGSFLCPPGYAGPTGLRAIAREGSAVTEAARFVRRSRADRRVRDAEPWATRTVERDLQPVVLVPGFMAGDASLALMARHLRDLGHRTYRSRMHANVGCTQAATEAMERRIEAIITLGSPILAPGAAHPALLFDLALVVRLQRAGFGRMMGDDCTSGACAQESWEQSQAPLPRGLDFTSVFSRRDGIIDWRSCLDPQARTVEVATSHVGMAWDPTVLDVVGDTLVANRARAQRRAAAGAVDPISSATSLAAPDASAG